MDETLAAPQLRRVEGLAQTLLGAASQTIRPASKPGGTSTQGRAAAFLGELLGDAGTPFAAGEGARGISLGRTLGQGGMGIVHLGTQNSMGRQVAVKTARADRRSDKNTVKLLREAWVNGALEHPNILPIYDLGLNDDGSPCIVMRLVDGTDWGDLMHNPALVAERFGEEDCLEWNLRVLMQVCNAVAFAHERELLHRDIKPRNVMLGRFGEVYLVDWGIAITWGDDAEGRFPVPEAQGEVVGTPAYMAPEMLRGDMAALAPTTDVYLLGAVLYEILNAKAPHGADSIGDFVASVMKSKPPFADDAPAELISTCRRAMDPDPSKRFADALDLRRALSSFLRHRSSMRLASEGLEGLESMKILLDESKAPDSHAKHHQEGPAGEAHADREDDARMRVEQLFVGSRFAFEAALREWSSNEEALVGLRDALLTMIRFHIRWRDEGAATRLANEIEDLPAELQLALQALREALAAQAAEQARLQRLDRDNDARIGQRTRWFILLALGTIWSGLPPLLAAFAAVPSGFLELALFPLAFLGLLGGFALWARESMRATAFNRRVTALLAATLLAQLVLTGGAALANWEITALLPMQFFLWFVIATAFSITLDHRFWPAAVAYLVAFIVASEAHGRLGDTLAFGRFALNVMGLSHFAMALTTLIVWRPRTYFKRLPDEHLRGSG